MPLYVLPRTAIDDVSNTAQGAKHAFSQRPNRFAREMSLANADDLNRRQLCVKFSLRAGATRERRFPAALPVAELAVSLVRAVRILAVTVFTDCGWHEMKSTKETMIEQLESRLCFDAVFPDANFDGHVGTQDFTALSMNFGQTTRADTAHGDFNQDNRTNAMDFNILASQFGETMATRTFGGILSTDINAPGTQAWLVAQPTSSDTGLFNASLFTNPPGSDSGSNRTWGGLDLSAFDENTTVFDKIAVSGVLALGTSQVAGTATFRDIGTATGVCSSNAALVISNLTGTVSGSNVASDGTLVVSGGNGTVECDNETAGYTLQGFVGTVHANSNKTCSFAASGTLSASLAFTGTGTNSIISTYVQGSYAGCEGFTVTGGAGGSYHVGDTYTIAWSSNRNNTGFLAGSVSEFDSSASLDNPIVNPVARTITGTIPEAWIGTPKFLSCYGTNGQQINIDTITVTAAAASGGNTSRLNMGLGIGL